MIERSHIEDLLRVNGLALNSAEEDIRLILAGASLSSQEISDALLLLRTQTEPAIVHEAATHKLFRTGEALRPAEISQLLGINVVVREIIFTDSKREKGIPLFQFMVLRLTSVVLAATVLTAYMYTQKVGIFHPAMAHSAFDDV